MLSTDRIAVAESAARLPLSRDDLACGLVLAAGALLLLAGLGNRDFWPPDEPRYGAIAEELRSFVHGWRGLVLLHVNGEVYTQKPPLYFWLAALAGAPGAYVTEAAARLPSALAGLATLLLGACLGRAMFGARAGVLGAAVLLTVPSWVQLARSARLDALLTACVTLAFAAAWRIERRSGNERLDRLALHAAIGLGVLTKGPVALLLPLLGVATLLGWERRLGELRRFVSAPSLLLSCGPGLAWVASAVALAPPDFASVSLWDNLALRFFSGTSHARPIWFYLESLPRGFLPWTLLWPLAWLRYRALARDGDGAHAYRFLLAAIGAALVFFSLSAGKRGVYLLPVYPLIALACGETLSSWLDAPGGAPRWLRRSVAGAAALVALAGLAALGIDRLGGVELPASFAGGLAASGVLAVLAQRALPVSRAGVVCTGLALALGVELAVHQGLHPALDARNSLRAVAVAAAAVSPLGAPIGVYRNDTVAAGVGYYARRPARELREARDVAAFRAAGGRAIVVEDDHLPALRRLLPVRELDTGRMRQRRLHVVTAAD